MEKAVFPEFDYSYSKAITVENLKVHLGFTSIENKEIESTITNQNNIFNLLFNSDYSHPNYIYTFTKKPIQDIQNNSLKYRLQTIKDLSVYYSDNSGTNVLNVTPEEITYLDLFLQFRTNAPIVLPADYNGISSPLSKILYSYMDYGTSGITLFNTRISEILVQINSSNTVPEIRKVLYKCLIITYLGNIIMQHI